MLGDAGKGWWSWAWHTPQAAAWSPGDLYAIVRRAQLEDRVAALQHVDDFDMGELLATDEGLERYKRLKSVIGMLKGMASGELQLMKEMRELDDRLGLTPKGMAALRWTIVDDEPVVATAPTSGVSKLSDRRARITNAS